MVKLNENFLNFKSDYLFAKIKEKEKKFLEINPTAQILNLGIGDITRPISSNAITGIKNALNELLDEKTVRGYGNAQGELFLREAIAENEYFFAGFDIDEIFISSGIKDDLAAIEELFSNDAKVAILDPAYPVYVDTNVFKGRSGKGKDDGTYENILYMPCLEENNFLPTIPKEKCDLIYLCSPNNPTGVAFSKKELEKWVVYAKQNKAIILYDGAYEAFISSEDKVKSIYEIDGAKDVAIEFRSFSKSAGFTGLRLSYYIIPKKLKIDGYNINSLWKRRVNSKYGGAPYVIQKGAYKLFSKEGKMQLMENVNAYKKNASILREGLLSLGFKVYGGIDSPYLWVKTLFNMTSFEFFDYLLQKAHIVSIPGGGFGKSGEGFFRLSAFAKKADILQALENLKNILCTKLN